MALQAVRELFGGALTAPVRMESVSFLEGRLRVAASMASQTREVGA